MTFSDGRPERTLTCREVGHRFNDEGQCIFCPATEPPNAGSTP